jgi:hypothetical protein
MLQWIASWIERNALTPEKRAEKALRVSMSTIFDGPMIIENDGRSARQVQLTAMARRRQELDNTIAGVTDAQIQRDDI